MMPRKEERSMNPGGNSSPGSRSLKPGGNNSPKSGSGGNKVRAKLEAFSKQANDNSR